MHERSPEYEENPQERGRVAKFAIGALKAVVLAGLAWGAAKGLNAVGLFPVDDPENILDDTPGVAYVAAFGSVAILGGVMEVKGWIPTFQSNEESSD